LCHEDGEGARNCKKLYYDTEVRQCDCQMPFRLLRNLSFFVSLALLTACETMPEGIQEARFAALQRIQAEPPGDYFIGRRYYKPDFIFGVTCAGPVNPGAPRSSSS